MALFAPGDPGMERSILIDGVELSILPSELDSTPEHASVYHEMMGGGSMEFQRRPYFDGVANLRDQWTHAIPYDALRGDNLKKMQLIRAAGGSHRVTVWRYEPHIYTCLAGVQTYYVPCFRKCAPWLYSGLALDGAGGGAADIVVSTVSIPVLATLDGADLDVTYAEGPTLADPGAGGMVISRQPVATGEKKGYVPMLLGDNPTTGDQLIVWGVWTHETSLRSVRISMRGNQEGHAYTFVED